MANVMTEEEKIATVQTWALFHGWKRMELERGHDALLHTVDEAIERSMHRTGVEAYLEWNCG